MGFSVLAAVSFLFIQTSLNHTSWVSKRTSEEQPLGEECACVVSGACGEAAPWRQTMDTLSFVLANPNLFACLDTSDDPQLGTTCAYRLVVNSYGS
jgi:hypothetical protein